VFHVSTLVEVKVKGRYSHCKWIGSVHQEAFAETCEKALLLLLSANRELSNLLPTPDVLALCVARTFIIPFATISLPRVFLVV